eukprot:scaffold65393_cov20-Tisochrysis_lutea.AAC.3
MLMRAFPHLRAPPGSISRRTTLKRRRHRRCAHAQPLSKLQSHMLELRAATPHGHAWQRPAHRYLAWLHTWTCAPGPCGAALTTHGAAASAALLPVQRAALLPKDGDRQVAVDLSARRAQAVEYAAQLRARLANQQRAEQRAD